MTGRKAASRPLRDHSPFCQALLLLLPLTAFCTCPMHNARAEEPTRLKPSSHQLMPDGATTLEMSREEAMWAAIAFEDAGRLKELLAQGADPNKPEELSQMTPLMAAETAPIAKILLDAGANPKLRDRTGRTALHHAVKMREAASVVQLLARAGVDVNARAKDSGENTPLLTAVDHYMEDKDRQETALVIRILIHLGADINAADSRGDTALGIAAAHNQPELIRLLIELGADPARRMGNGRTPLDYALEANAQDAVHALAALSSKPLPAN
jgi:ankyrin repeat protein